MKAKVLGAKEKEKNIDKFHCYLLNIRLGEKSIATPHTEAHYGSTQDGHQRDNLW